MTRLYKTKIKSYPNGDKTLTVYKNALIVKIDDDSIDVSISEKTEKTDDEKELEKIRNLWKIRTKIKDYVLSNEFNYFWTLTFDSDRYNYAVAF
ncbi:hypothetical protein ABZ487_32050, partial [Micromonospora aurantiaca]